MSYLGNRAGLLAAAPPPPEKEESVAGSALDPVFLAEAAFASTLPPPPSLSDALPPSEFFPSKGSDSPALHPPGDHLATVRGLAITGPPEAEMREEFSKAFGIGGLELIRQMETLVEKTINQITASRAYFRDDAVVRSVQNASKRSVEEKFLEHPAFADLIKWCVDKRPFVPIENTPMFTTQEMWEAEQLMLDLAEFTSPIYEQDENLVNEAIARKKGISDEQIAAVIAACRTPNRVTVIEGTAGAGKSFTMEAVKETYQAAGYDVLGTALGWAAAKVLGESAKLEDANCRAIEGMVRSWVAARAHGTDPFQRPTLLIVDEAGMVGTIHMSTILAETARSRYPVKVVLTGDSLQVVPVAAGNAMEAIIEFNGTTRIDTIRRQKQMSHRRAVRQLSRKQAGAALHTFMHQESIHWCKDKDMLFNKVVQDYLSWRLENTDKKALVLTLSNADVLELNHRLRNAFKKLGLLGDEEARFKVNNGIETFEADFSVGDEVLLRANDRNMFVYEINLDEPLDKPSSWKPSRLGVFNRNAGRIVHMKRSRDPVGSWDFTIDLSGDKPGRVVVNSDTFRSHDKEGMPMIHNYAGTIYGSQGQTVSHSFFIDNPRLDFRLSYVGLSRHKDGVDIYLDETELHRRLDQVMGRGASLEQMIELKKQGKKLEDAHVELGRYPRAEMMRAVARTWGKHSDNLTATMYERSRRLGLKKFKDDIEELSNIRPLHSKDILIDFLPSSNKSPRIIDVDALLSLPDPVKEQELVRPSDVEINRSRYEATQMPLDADDTPLPLNTRSSAVRRRHPSVLPRTDKDDHGFFGKAMSWMVRSSKTISHQDDRPHGPLPVLRQEDPRSAFEGLDGLAPPPPPDPVALAALRASIAKILNPKPRIEIPYKDMTSPCGRVLYPSVPQQESVDIWIAKQLEILPSGSPPPIPTSDDIKSILAWENSEAEKKTGEDCSPDPRSHGLSFDGVPQVLGTVGGPDDEWLAQHRGVLWDIGRFGEPRILAKDRYGQVVARYRMDGKCVVGDGYPPIIVSHNSNPRGPIYLVAGAKEWLWLRQSMEKTYEADPSRIPHIVWAAKDTDLAAIGDILRSAERVVVVRSKTDDRQIPWAMGVHKMLSERLRVTSAVSPPVSEEEILAVQDRLSAAADKETVVSSPPRRSRGP